MRCATQGFNGEHNCSEKSIKKTSQYSSLLILAPNTRKARWFIVSFLTVPKLRQQELGVMFQAYLEAIFANPKFNPVFSYFAPMAPASDALLSVWGFESSQDARIYMPVRLVNRVAWSIR